jgi:hypothetical protein
LLADDLSRSDLHVLHALHGEYVESPCGCDAVHDTYHAGRAGHAGSEVAGGGVTLADDLSRSNLHVLHALHGEYVERSHGLLVAVTG